MIEVPTKLTCSTQSSVQLQRMGKNCDFRDAFIFKSKSGKEFPFVCLFFSLHPFPSPFPPNLFGLRLTCAVHLSPCCEVITDQHWVLISSRLAADKREPQSVCASSEREQKMSGKNVEHDRFFFPFLFLFFTHTRLSGVTRVERKPYHVQAICSLGTSWTRAPLSD